MLRTCRIEGPPIIPEKAQVRTMNLNALQAPFASSDIEWRIGQAGETNSKVWATALAYLTSRAVMDRLDAVCGPENWKNEYRPGPAGGILCGISIRCGDGWITKWDGAENTQVEAVKGGLSDALKRTAVQWGIGRYLYNLPMAFATIAPDSERKANKGSYKLKTGETRVLPLVRPISTRLGTARPSRPAACKKRLSLGRDRAEPVVTDSRSGVFSGDSAANDGRRTVHHNFL